jgi:3-polyprenyl-4-hydroxybenzoate decarboxylase
MKVLSMFYPVETWVDIGVNAMLGASLYMVVVWLVAKDIDKFQLSEVWHSLARRNSSN